MVMAVEIVDITLLTNFGMTNIDIDLSKWTNKQFFIINIYFHNKLR